MNSFKNPYLSLPKDETIRTTIFASKKDIALLKSFDPKEGVFQTTLATLLTKLCHELRTATTAKRIEQGDFSAYQHAVTNATIHLGIGGAVAEPATGPVAPRPVETTRPNVRRRASRVALKVKGPQEPNDAQSASERGGSEHEGEGE